MVKRTPMLEQLDSRLCMAFGDIDVSFGSNGFVRQDFPLSHTAFGSRSAKVDLVDGSTVRIGDHFVGHGVLLSGVKINSQGELSTTFGSNGRMQYPSHYTSYGLGPLVATPDGGFVVSTWHVNQLNEILKFTADGVLDTSFGSNGITQTSLSGPITDISVLPDGSLIVLEPLNASRAILSKLTSSGAQDVLFGSNGRTVLELPGRFVSALAIAMNGDGTLRVLAVENTTGKDRNFALGITADGHLDVKFGDGGLMLLEEKSFHQILVDPLDGSRTLAYWFETVDSTTTINLRRYLLDGRRDPSFGTADGEAKLALPHLADRQFIQLSRLNDQTYRLFYSRASALAIDKLLISARLLHDGSLDTGYGDQGVAITTVRMDWLQNAQLSELSDGRSIVTGRGYSRFTGPTGTTDDFQIIGLTTHGQLDEQYGDQGVQAIDWYLPSNQGHTMGVIQTTDALIATVSEGAEFNFYTRNGQPATARASDGRFTAIRPRTDRDFQWLAANNAKTLTATLEYPEGTTRVQVRRYLANGQLDLAFGDQGLVAVDNGEWASIKRLIELPDSKLLLLVDMAGVMHLRKFDSLGRPDILFGTDGLIEVPFGSTNLLDIAVRPDGSLILLANQGSDAQRQTQLMHWDANGIANHAFGIEGVFKFDARYRGALPVQLSLDSQGRILLVHAFADHYWLSRVTRDGQVDTSFGDQGRVILPDQTRRANIFSRAALAHTASHIFVGLTTGTRDRAASVYAIRQDGSLDNSFGTNGRTHLSHSPYDDEVQNIETLVDGSVLVAYRVVDGMNAYGMLAKLEGQSPTPFPSHNLLNPWNVNPSTDSQVTALDALLLINYLNNPADPGSLFSSTGARYFLDVSADNSITPLDVLLIINYLNRQVTGAGEGAGEGEKAFDRDSPDSYSGVSAAPWGPFQENQGEVAFEFVDMEERKVPGLFLKPLRRRSV